MADVFLDSSPLAPGRSPVRIHYRDAGSGPPIVVLHGGWGYDAYPYDAQIAGLSSSHRVVIPDRTGYGGSESIDVLPTDFHHRAAGETRAVIDALGLERPILWGHSDGAIVALLMGLADPTRLSGIIAEATHFFRHKPASREFFARIVASPRTPLLGMHSRTWLRIVDEARAGEDFYGGELARLSLPVLLIHGDRDPRTEPGELKALANALAISADGHVGPRRSATLVLPEGGHSPHSESLTCARVTDAALSFVAEPPRDAAPVARLSASGARRR